MTEELLAKQTTLNSTASELQQLRDMSAHQRKRIAEMLANFLKDLGEIGVAIGGDENLKVKSATSFKKFYMMQLYKTLNILFYRLHLRKAMVNLKKNLQWQGYSLAK